MVYNDGFPLTNHLVGPLGLTRHLACFVGTKFSLAVDWQSGFFVCDEHADHRARVVGV